MSGLDPPLPMSSERVTNLRGQAKVPGDKSISHRSLILGALSVGQTKIHGLLEGQDVIDTAKAMSSFGALVEKHENVYWTVDGFGVGGAALIKALIMTIALVPLILKYSKVRNLT